MRQLTKSERAQRRERIILDICLAWVFLIFLLMLIGGAVYMSDGKSAKRPERARIVASFKSYQRTFVAPQGFLPFGPKM